MIMSHCMFCKKKKDNCIKTSVKLHIFVRIMLLDISCRIKYQSFGKINMFIFINSQQVNIISFKFDMTCTWQSIKTDDIIQIFSFLNTHVRVHAW